MKPTAIKIDRILPSDEGDVLNFRFMVEFHDPESQSPYFMHATVAVNVTSDAYPELARKAADKLQRLFAALGSIDRPMVDKMLATEFHDYTNPVVA